MNYWKHDCRRPRTVVLYSPEEIGRALAVCVERGEDIDSPRFLEMTVYDLIRHARQ